MAQVVSGTPSLTSEINEKQGCFGSDGDGPPWRAHQMQRISWNDRKLKALAVDKTGTISEGRPRVTRVVSVDSNDKAEIGRIAAAFDRRSDHPLIWDRTLLAIWHRQSSESSTEAFDF